jgi:hypothetical protein
LTAFTIFTNNPMVYERFQKAIPDDVIWVNAGAQDVLAKVRSAVNKGAVLLSHPFSGGLKPGLSPYKSILVSKSLPQADFQSAKRIDEALSVYKKNAKLKYMSYNDKVLNDFQMIDLDSIAAALSELMQAGKQ